MFLNIFKEMYKYLRPVERKYIIQDVAYIKSYSTPKIFLMDLDINIMPPPNQV